jgi:hypothetical protein
MKVHLLKTVDFSEELYDGICVFLKKFRVPLDFLKVKSSSVASLRNGFMQHEAFELCENYRKENRLPTTDIVVVLSTEREAGNWFSHYDLAGNVFVSTYGIDEICSEISPVYYCVYEIVENILQNAMQLDVSNQSHSALYIHDTPRGCMNDFCETKEQIKLKLLTANICSDCYKHALEVGISSSMIVQIQAIAEKIRLQIITNPKQSKDDLSSVVYNKKTQRLYLKDSGKELKMTKLSMTIYLFFMQHPEGKNVIQLKQNHTDELLRIYDSFSYQDNQNRTENPILNLFKEDAFTKNKYVINKELSSAIGDPIAKNYHLKHDKIVYKIDLPKHMLEVIYE